MAAEMFFFNIRLDGEANLGQLGKQTSMLDMALAWLLDIMLELNAKQTVSKLHGRTSKQNNWGFSVLLSLVSNKLLVSTVGQGEMSGDSPSPSATAHLKSNLQIYRTRQKCA